MSAFAFAVFLLFEWCVVDCVVISGAFVWMYQVDPAPTYGAAVLTLRCAFHCEYACCDARAPAVCASLLGRDVIFACIHVRVCMCV